jgi:hypothetical protein
MRRSRTVPIMKFFRRPRPAEAPRQNPLEREVRRLGAIIGADDRDLVCFVPVDGAHPFVRRDANGEYYWCVRERGQELENRRTTDPDELLYWALEWTTYNMAARWALEHPTTGQEQRVTRWIRQFELLDALDSGWARRCRDKVVNFVESHDCLPEGGMPPLPRHHSSSQE